MAVARSQIWLCTTGLPWVIVRFEAPAGRTCFTVRDLYHVMGAFAGRSGQHTENIELNKKFNRSTTNCFVSIGPPLPLELEESGGSVRAYLTHVVRSGDMVLFLDYGKIDAGRIEPDRLTNVRCLDRWEPGRVTSAELEEMSRSLFTVRWSCKHGMTNRQYAELQYAERLF